MEVLIQSLERVENYKEYFSNIINTSKIYTFKGSEIALKCIPYFSVHKGSLFIESDYFINRSIKERDYLIILHLMILNDTRKGNKYHSEKVIYFYNLLISLDIELCLNLEIPLEYAELIKAIEPSCEEYQNPIANSLYEKRNDYYPAKEFTLFSEVLPNLEIIDNDFDNQSHFELINYESKNKELTDQILHHNRKFKGDTLYDYWIHLNEVGLYSEILGILNKNISTEKEIKRGLDRRRIHKGDYRNKNKESRKKVFKYKYLKIVNHAIENELINCMREVTLTCINGMKKYGMMEVLITQFNDNELNDDESLNLHIFNSEAYDKNKDNLPEYYFVVLSELIQIKDYQSTNVLFENNCDYTYRLY